MEQSRMFLDNQQSPWWMHAVTFECTDSIEAVLLTLLVVNFSDFAKHWNAYPTKYKSDIA